jgi:hypothetical protein
MQGQLPLKPKRLCNRASAAVTRQGGDGSPAQGKSEPAPSPGAGIGRGPSAARETPKNPVLKKRLKFRLKPGSRARRCSRWPRRYSPASAGMVLGASERLRRRAALSPEPHGNKVAADGWVFANDWRGERCPSVARTSPVNRHPMSPSINSPGSMSPRRTARIS